MLSEYYFSSVCRIISGFDSPKNPLRIWTAKLLPQSPVVYNCVLSISAAHLVQQRKAAGTLALVHSTNALSCLSNEVARLENPFPCASLPLLCHIETRNHGTSTDAESLSLTRDSIASPVAALLFGIIMLGMTSVSVFLFFVSFFLYFFFFFFFFFFLF